MSAAAAAAAAVAAVVAVARRDAARATVPLSASTRDGDAMARSARATYGLLARTLARAHPPSSVRAKGRKRERESRQEGKGHRL